MRYKLHLPVIFYWNDGVLRTDAGFTCDVAVNGALICSTKRPEECPGIGSDIEIQVLIPSPNQHEELRIQCIGVVTRVVVSNGATYFGVEGGFDDDHITSQADK